MPRETGGVLLGYWGNEKEVVITTATGPGPRSVHRRSSFHPDNDFHTEEISRHYRESGRTETYLGDWHTHPEAAAYMSRRDEVTLAAIARYPEARQGRPVMLILGTAPFGVKAWVCQIQRRFPITKKVFTPCLIKLYRDLP